MPGAEQGLHCHSHTAVPYSPLLTALFGMVLAAALTHAFREGRP